MTEYTNRLNSYVYDMLYVYNMVRLYLNMKVIFTKDIYLLKPILGILFCIKNLYSVYCLFSSLLRFIEF